MKIQRLETERLILRAMCLADVPIIQKYFNNWNIIKNLSLEVPWPYPEDGAKSFFENVIEPGIKEDKYCHWVITIKENEKEPIGVIHYRLYDCPNGNRGFWLAEDFWNRGFMTEAVNVANDWIFSNTDLDKIIVCNAVGNIQSKRIKEKTGCKYLGTESLAHHNGVLFSEKWELTKEAWFEFRK